MLRGRFWLWAKRLAGVSLALFCLVYWAARTDRLNAVGYDVLFIAIAAPAVLLGVEEKTVILGLLDQHCGGGHRWPIYGLEARKLFTCRSTDPDETETISLIFKPCSSCVKSSAPALGVTFLARRSLYKVGSNASSSLALTFRQLRCITKEASTVCKGRGY